jgi:hypothetical protein
LGQSGGLAVTQKDCRSNKKGQCRISVPALITAAPAEAFNGHTIEALPLVVPLNPAGGG